MAAPGAGAWVRLQAGKAGIGSALGTSLGFVLQVGVGGSQEGVGVEWHFLSHGGGGDRVPATAPSRPPAAKLVGGTIHLNRLWKLSRCGWKAGGKELLRVGIYTLEKRP